MPAKTIDAKNLKKWLDNNEAILVDVREPAEFEAERIKGSKLIPLQKVSAGALPETNGKKLVIHCKKGGRGGNACTKLLAEKPELEVYNLEGGIDAWKLEGFAIASSGKFFLPLDRQVQLTIGLSILATITLGFTVSSVFFFVTALFGFGLIFAGLTGFCGLARLMAIMPWNQKAG